MNQLIHYESTIGQQIILPNWPMTKLIGQQKNELTNGQTKKGKFNWPMNKLIGQTKNESIGQQIIDRSILLFNFYESINKQNLQTKKFCYIDLEFFS